MSNSTPAAIRAKNKERKQREKQAKQVKQVKVEQKARWWSRAKLIWTVVIFLLFTGMPALLSYFPHLAVYPTSSVSPHEALGTVFNLTNNGLLPVYEVVHTCQVETSDGAGGGIKGGIGITHGDPKLGNLEAGMTKSLSCERTVRGAVTASMTIWITYRSLLWPLKITKFFQFEAEKADDGTWVWKAK